MNWTDLAAALAVGAFIAAIWVIGLWLLSIARRDISIIDAVFTLIEVSIIGIAGVAMGSAPDARKALIFGLLCLWSIRLTAHLGWRKWGEGEDPRYTKLRGWVDEGWPFHRLALRQVFGLQGLTMYLLSLPALIALTAEDPGADGVHHGRVFLLLDSSSTGLVVQGLVFRRAFSSSITRRFSA